MLAAVKQAHIQCVACQQSDALTADNRDFLPALGARAGVKSYKGGRQMRPVIHSFKAGVLAAAIGLSLIGCSTGCFEREHADAGINDPQNPAAAEELVSSQSSSVG